MKNKNWKIIFVIVIMVMIFSAIYGIIIYKKNSYTVFAVISPVLANPVTTNSATVLLGEQKKEAAIRGIDWLISQKDITPTKANVVNFSNIYQSAADEKIAQESLEIVKEKFLSLPELNTSIDITDKKYLDWSNGLRPVADGLLQKKCAGIDYAKDAKSISRLLTEHSQEIFPANMQLSSKLIAAYILKKIGMDKDNFYVRTVSEVQSKLSIMNSLSNGNYIKDLYALTHIVLAESDYFGDYLNPQDYPNEVINLNNALDVFSVKNELSDVEADIAAEIVFSLKLFCIPADERVNNIYQKLIALQNEDGSWGQGEDSDKNPNNRESSLVHHTMVAVLALMDYAPEFRVKDAHCVSINQ